jgi:hypothetical protein
MFLFIWPTQGHKENISKIHHVLPLSYLNLTDTVEMPQEQVILHVANNQLEKDVIFFKSYIFSGYDFNGKNISDVLVVELIDSNAKVIKTQFHRISNGQVNGNMELDKKIKPGEYVLWAYTKGMKNYEDAYAKHRVLVGDFTAELAKGAMSIINVVPEGGVLLKGYTNRLVIELKDDNELDNGIIGKVVDDENKKVAEIYKFSDRLAATILNPLESRSYRLELLNGSNFPIPTAANSGYQLRVNSVDAKKIIVRVRVTPDLVDKEVKLTAAIGGNTYLETPLKFQNNAKVDLQLNKEDFPDGIFNFELIDSDQNILVSRPFIVNRNPLSIGATLSVTSNEEKRIKLKVTDANGSPVQTQLSVSVTPPFEKEVAGYESCKQPDVFNLFTETDQGGFANVKDERKELFINDLNIQLIHSDFNATKQKEFIDVQKGLDFNGYAYDLNNNPLPNTKIQVMGVSKTQNIFLETQTDVNGLLVLTNLDITGESELVFRTKGEDSKERLVKVIPVPSTTIKKDKAGANQLVNTPLKTKGATNNTDAQFDESCSLIELEEVQVSDNKIEKYYSPSNYSLPETSSKLRVKFQDYERPKTIELMLAEFNGVNVKDMGTFNPSVSIIRASGPILFVIDGFALAQEDEAPLSGLSPLGEVLSLVQPQDVHKIELLLGPDAALFGARGSGGAILITTRHGAENDFIKRKEGMINFQGYEPVIDFESYYNEISKRDRQKLNLLYWNPNLETDENGEAIITIDTPLDMTNFNLKTYTITPQGASGKLIKTF